MSVAHILWVFDLAGPDRTFQTRDEVIKIVNNSFLANCTAGIDYAYAVWVASNSIIAPNKFDAAVFVVNDVRDSLMKKIGANANEAKNNSAVLGLTTLGVTGGGLAEVYWNRCVNNSEVAASIFHEAAHLKSGKVDLMHNAPGVRVLMKNGAQNQYPSWGDLEFYEAAIKRRITIRRMVP